MSDILDAIPLWFGIMFWTVIMVFGAMASYWATEAWESFKLRWRNRNETKNPFK